MKIRSNVKAGGDASIRPPDGGGFINNHNQTLRVKSNVEATGEGRPSGGGWISNHNQSLKVKSSVKAGEDRGGSFGFNHNQTLCVRSQLKAGAVSGRIDANDIYVFRSPPN